MPEERGTGTERVKTGALEAVLPGLYATQPEPLPFGHALEIRAFLLRRANGNLLLYSVRGLEQAGNDIAELGGISRHYLNHRHEAGFASDWVEAPLFVHARERESVAKSYRVAGTFTERHAIDDDFEIIPTPGHTSGATAYLWNSGEQRMLFTGDSIYVNQGEWIAAVLTSSDRHAYIESLELIRQLDFDVLVPWVASRGEAPAVLTDQVEARRRIGAILERVKRGLDH